MFKRKWKPKHLRVYDDGFMEIYNERSSIELEAKLNVLKIQPHLLIGKNILLGQIKKLPNSSNVCLLMGYPEDVTEKKPNYQWVLFSSGHDLRKFHEIMRQLVSHSSSIISHLSHCDPANLSIRVEEKSGTRCQKGGQGRQATWSGSKH